MNINLLVWDVLAKARTNISHFLKKMDLIYFYNIKQVIIKKENIKYQTMFNDTSIYLICNYFKKK